MVVSMFHLSTYFHEFVRLVAKGSTWFDVCRSFYVKPAFFTELYLTLQTDFTTRWCSMIFCQWLFYWTISPTPAIQIFC